MVSHLESYYEQKITELRTRRTKARLLTFIFSICSVIFVYQYIQSVEKATLERSEQTYETVKNYYKNPEKYNKEGFTEETLNQLVSINLQAVNNGKSLLDSLLGYLTLIFSAISAASLNYCFQLSNKMDEYNEKYTIELQKNEMLTSSADEDK